MKHYEIGEYIKFRSDFQRLLPDVPTMDLYDALMTMYNDRITIDILVLGRRIERMYPEDWERMSIKDIIIKYYGPEAMRLINSVL